MLLCVAGFRPGSRACCLVRPEGGDFRLVGPVGHNLCVEQKDPTTVALFETHHATVTPRPASSDKSNAGHERAGQLAELVLSLLEGLKQGPPVDRSVRLWDRAAGAGQGKKDLNIVKGNTYRYMIQEK